MLAWLTGPDAVVLAALVALVPAVLSWLNSRTAAKATRPNGGSSMRDAVDRIESKLDEHLARLNRGAVVMADHEDRLAVIEAHQHPTPPNTVKDNT